VKAETEVKTAHMLLDDLSVPSSDSEGTLNLVGRLVLIESVVLARVEIRPKVQRSES